MDRGAWQVTVHSIMLSQTQLKLLRIHNKYAMLQTIRPVYKDLSYFSIKSQEAYFLQKFDMGMQRIPKNHNSFEIDEQSKCRT